MPFILAMLGYLGIFHPKFSTTCTFLWVIGKYAYTVSSTSYMGALFQVRMLMITQVGYATGDPSKRVSRDSLLWCTREQLIANSQTNPFSVINYFGLFGLSFFMPERLH